jgi:alkylation response protein AidB-like acyl-CoA dehydrogenase
MDLDLSADQIALRDGIAALLDGRFGMDRVRGGFDRAMFAELAEAGVFSLRDDGFSWADCTIVFEQLGRFCVPGPLLA